jgi:hypothetical protein
VKELAQTDSKAVVLACFVVEGMLISWGNALILLFWCSFLDLITAFQCKTSIGG